MRFRGLTTVELLLYFTYQRFLIGKNVAIMSRKKEQKKRMQITHQSEGYQEIQVDTLEELEEVLNQRTDLVTMRELHDHKNDQDCRIVETTFADGLTMHFKAHDNETAKTIAFELFHAE